MTTTAAPAAGSATRVLRVLVVDDDAMNLRIAARLLRELGHAGAGGAEVDHRAAPRHVRPAGAQEHRRAEDIHREGLLPVLPRRGGALVGVHGGHVDQAVDAPEGLHRGLNAGVDVGVAAHVGGDETGGLAQLRGEGAAAPTATECAPKRHNWISGNCKPQSCE